MGKIMNEQDQYIGALVALHRGLERLGPGDPQLSEEILSGISNELPKNPRIADMGCGTGAGALLLAERFQTKVRAVEFSGDFLRQLSERAKERGIGHLVDCVEDDMGNLDWATASVDLLWSEGAAYNLTFEGALKAWRPLMATNGIAVISEMSYFAQDVPAPVRAYWDNAYPAMAEESKNKKRAESCGFGVLGTQRLPSQAWWDSYYGPLRDKIAALGEPKDPVMKKVIAETEEEMAYFEAHDAYYGYTFYLLRAV
jgi:SAM-dependent methyltransferase